jgi:DNA-binding response OmpR family regulator
VQQILIIEDERPIAQSLAYTLKREGFNVAMAEDGAEGLRQALASPPPSLIILDLMLPTVSGLDICRIVREQQKTWIPIIMLTAKAEEIDRVIGLETGADDYLTKPFSMRELVARVKATLRRPATDAAPDQIISHLGVDIDMGRHSVIVDGKTCDLSPKEFDLLVLLIRHKGQAMSREEILHKVWEDEGPFRDPHTVDVHIRWLREKIEYDPAKPERLLTLRGVGYKFAE